MGNKGDFLMSGISAFFRRFFLTLAGFLRRFMEGRNGTDQFNIAILCAGLAASLLSVLVSVQPFNLIFWALSYVLMIWAIFRSLSRNTYKRYLENRKFLQFTDRLKDREHRYYSCPKCRQTVRVPRGRGKIAITCPKCREKFTKKT